MGECRRCRRAVLEYDALRGLPGARRHADVPVEAVKFRCRAHRPDAEVAGTNLIAEAAPRGESLISSLREDIGKLELQAGQKGGFYRLVRFQR